MTKTCVRGHEYQVRPALKSGRQCPVCKREASRQWGLKNPQKNSKSRTAASLKWHFANPGHLYKLSNERYATLLKAQDNCCAICKKPFDDTPRIDHDHVTGKVRELLCDVCNKGLGYFKDNLDFLQAAVDYLKRHGNV